MAEKLIKKYPCIESTVDFDYGDIRIRLWINEDDLIPSDMTANIHNIKAFLFEVGVKDRIEIINYIAKEIPNVNAVQVMDRYLNDQDIRFGTVAYTVDFSEDVHG